MSKFFSALTYIKTRLDHPLLSSLVRSKVSITLIWFALACLPVVIPDRFGIVCNVVLCAAAWIFAFLNHKTITDVVDLVADFFVNVWTKYHLLFYVLLFVLVPSLFNRVDPELVSLPKMNFDLKEFITQAINLFSIFINGLWELLFTNKA
jgi:hypothetical protein